MKTYLYPILLLLFFTTFQVSGANLVIQEDYLGYIGTKVSYYADEESKLDLEQFINQKDSGNLSQSDQEIFIRASAIPSYWFHFTAKSELSEKVWLNLNNSNLSRIDFYKLDESNQILEEFHTGNTADRSTGAFNCNTFWFPIIDEGDPNEYQYIFRIKAALSLELPIEVGTFPQLIASKERSDYLAYFFIGAMLIMFGYNCSLFIFTKDKIYGVYAFYILSIISGTTFLNNYPILENFLGMELTYNYTACWLWSNFVGIGVFAMIYLELKSVVPKMYKLIWIELGIILFFGILNLFIPVDKLSLSYQIVVVIFYGTCLFTAYYYMWKLRDKRATLYSIGWTLMMLGGIVFLMVINGLIPYTAITRNMMYFGVMSEVLIFSIALARRLNVLKAEQEALNSVLANTNRELYKNNEALDSFNYHVSHDLKTVLNNSNALSQMIEKYNELDNKEKVDEIAKKLIKVTQNGSETVQSFLSLGRVDDILKNESETIIEPSKELREIIDRNDLKTAIGVNIITDEIRTMSIHEKAFESICLNFLTNAIKYNKNSPQINVHFKTEKVHDVLIFSDNGIGMDLKKYGDIIFEPFQRGNVREGQEGTGVGLYLVKRIVSSYNGELDVDSIIGKGTTFTVKIPRKR